jgi:hypothetical protein
VRWREGDIVYKEMVLAPYYQSILNQQDENFNEKYTGRSYGYE